MGIGKNIEFPDKQTENHWSPTMNTWLFAHPYEATSPHDVHSCSRRAAGWAGSQWVAQGSLAALQWFGQAQMMAETKWPLDKRQMHGQEKHLKPQCFLTWTHRQRQDAGWERGPQHSTPSASQHLLTRAGGQATCSAKWGLVATAQLRDAQCPSTMTGSTSTTVSPTPGKNLDVAIPITHTH